MGKGRVNGIGVGGSSILVIFILLCLTTFSTLSLATANADRNLTARTAAATQEYYAADAQAEEILSEIDRLLFINRRIIAAPPDDFSADIYLDRFMTALAQQPDLTLDLLREEQQLYIGYTVPAGESSELVVRLRVSPADPARYQITEWRLSPVGEWEPQSEGFTLWDGGL